MMLASYTGYRRLRSKTNGPACLPCSFDFEGNREAQSDRNASLPEGVCRFTRNWKAHGAPGAMDSNLKTHDAYPSRQLGRASSTIPCMEWWVSLCLSCTKYQLSPEGKTLQLPISALSTSCAGLLAASFLLFSSGAQRTPVYERGNCMLVRK